MGTPIEIYRHPQTAFAATFFGQPSELTDYRKFHTFEDLDGAEKAIVRPEFVKVTKKTEFQKFRSSASEGVVERVSFRGDNIELTIRSNDSVFIAKRGLDEPEISVGEKVDVFIYRIFVTAGERAFQLENKSLQEESVFI
jgi:sulfate transport system ATP-binding protein